MTPIADDTALGAVQASIDGTTMVPLRLEVFAKSGGSAVIQFGFNTVSYDPIDAGDVRVHAARRRQGDDQADRPVADEGRGRRQGRCRRARGRHAEQGRQGRAPEARAPCPAHPRPGAEPGRLPDRFGARLHRAAVPLGLRVRQRHAHDGARQPRLRDGGPGRRGSASASSPTGDVRRHDGPRLRAPLRRRLRRHRPGADARRRPSSTSSSSSCRPWSTRPPSTAPRSAR